MAAKKPAAPAKKATKRAEAAVRYRDAREDASIKSISKRIEKDYGLPAGSVTIKNPTGTKARSDGKVGSLRKRWDA